MTDSAEEFLAHHADPRDPPILSDGQVVGGWRVVAFLGRGGSGEVYRVVFDSQTVALKILARNTDTARARFLREVSLLAHTDNPAFPRFIAQGEVDGRPYLVMELLEPRALPSSDAEVADFLLKLCGGVAALHRMGYVHRDIKPGNILWRVTPHGGRSRSCASAVPVLIDLGLVKDMTRDPDASGTSLTLVDGHVAGVGTPGYAAPEQLVGDALSPAADIHALGMLANTCFGGQPLPVWGRIIDRATGSIPARRYHDVAAFARAVRHRHWWINAVFPIACTLLFAAIAIVTSRKSIAAREQDAWAALCADVVTNRIYQVVVDIKSAVTNETPFNPRLLSVTPLAYHCRPVTNAVLETIIRLGGRTNVFVNAIRLDATREYRIVGPGMLDAVLTGPANPDPRRRSKATAREMRTETDSHTGLAFAVGGLSPGEIVDEVPSNGVVRLENCVLRNRTDERWPENGLYYVLEGRARLELPNIEEVLDFRRGDFVATPVPGGCAVLLGAEARRQ